MADEKIRTQIEKSADLYQPAIYDLLTFYSSLQTEEDPLEGQFVPMTSVPNRNVKDTLIFAVGLIPPSAAVTGRILDRSASVESIIQTDYTDIIANSVDIGSSSDGDLPGQTSGISTSTPSPVGPKSSDDPDFWVQYVVMCNRLKCDPIEMAKVVQSESGFSNAPQSGPFNKKGEKIAKGIFQLTRKTALEDLKMSSVQYDQFESLSAKEQLVWMEKFYKNRAQGKNAGELKLVTLGGYNNPGGSIYHSNAVALGFQNAKFQENAYLQNKGLDKEKKGYITKDDLNRASAKLKPEFLANIQAAQNKLGTPTEPTPVTPTDTPTTEEWTEAGADNAIEAALLQTKLANTALDQAQLTQELTIAQNAQVLALREAIEQMANTPPLRLLVNPSSFGTSLEKIQSDTEFSRSGNIIHHFVDNQDRIEGSGKIAAFYSISAFDTNGGPGLTRSARQFSASYQNLLSLWLIYKNNGGIWLPDPFAPNKNGTNLSVVGSVYLYYDGCMYVGSFDSFEITESVDTPYSLEYSFSFVVRSYYLLDHLEDAQYTYGAAVPNSLKNTTGTST